MILDTAEELYKYFLSEVRKERTIVITPLTWTAFVNPILIDWVKIKQPEREFNQKRIDDLQAIKVLTDSRQYNYIHSLYDTGNIFPIPDGSGNQPAYMFGLSVQFGWSDIDETGNTEDDGEEDSTRSGEEDTSEPIPSKSRFAFDNRIGGKILRSDKRVLHTDNPYRKEDNEEFLYFEQRGSYIYGISTTKNYNRMILEYYKYPEQIVYDGSTDNTGSFMPNQNKEIMDMAVTRYLERVSDQRIQTQPSVSAQVPK